MDRRRFLLTSLAGALVTPLATDAEQTGRVYRIGVLTVEYPGTLRESLRELGYVEGRDLIFEVRDTRGAEWVDELAAELAHQKVDVIVATYPAATISAKRVTRTIPIVMVNTPDPVDLGLVASLAQPGGNITGMTSLSADISVKQVELLKAAVPRASRLVVLWNRDNPWHPLVVRALRDQKQPLGVQVETMDVRSPDDFDTAFQAMIRDRVGAALVLADPMTFAHRGRLADLGIKHRLPLMGALRGYAEAGCLMSYWADEVALFRRAATYVVKILKGAKPADLPIEQPTKFELVINLKTAKALNLTIPPSLLARADEVIE